MPEIKSERQNRVSSRADEINRFNHGRQSVIEMNAVTRNFSHSSIPSRLPRPFGTSQSLEVLAALLTNCALSNAVFFLLLPLVLVPQSSLDSRLSLFGAASGRARRLITRPLFGRRFSNGFHVNTAPSLRVSPLARSTDDEKSPEESGISQKN